MNLYHALEDAKDSRMLYARPIEGLAWEVPARNQFSYELDMDEDGTSKRSKSPQKEAKMRKSMR